MKKLMVILVMICSLVMITACKAKEFTVTLKFEDGTVFETLTVEEGKSTTLNIPTKEGYTFEGWYNADQLVDGSNGFSVDTELVAKFTINTYSYKFIVDGTAIKEGTLEYGSEIEYPSDPTKEDTDEYSYVFKGWDNPVTKLLKDEVFNAVFESSKNTYLVKFVDDNGSVISSETYEYGATIKYPEDPTKEATKEYTYTFSGWNNDATTVTKNLTIKATYSKVKNQYTYKFVNFDGSVLKEEKVDYGTMPVAPSDPTKEATSESEYEFIGWDKNISKVVDDVIYTAVFKEKEIKEAITSLEGLKISFLGDSITTFYAEGSAMNSYYGGENQFYYPRYSASIKTVDLTWWYKLIKNNNMVLGINNSWSGSTAYGTNNSCGQSDYRINTIDENGDPDIVIVYLGTNDLASGFALSDFGNAIKTIISKINAKCDAQIFLTTLGYSAYDNGKYKEENRILYNAKLRELATSYDCGIIPLDEYVIEDNYMIYLGDRLHYNAKGADLLSLIAEKAIKEYNNISFDKEINLEHQEKLPEGVVGKITATTDMDFWDASEPYKNNVFLVPSSFSNPKFSLRIEITKNTDNGKYYVSKIQKSGESTPYACDLVLIISDSHQDATALKKLVENVAVGNIVEFDETISFPVELIFKEGDGNVVTPPVEEPEPEVNPPVEGQLHVGAYNTGVWVESIYSKNAIIFSSDAMDVKSTYINYYLINLTFDETVSKYKITGLKTVDVTFTVAECDYYVLIYRDLADKTYFENAKLGDYVVINGDVTTGSCNILFE